MEQYTLRKIIEDNAKNLDLPSLDQTMLLAEADRLQNQLPKSMSFKTRVRIAYSMLKIAVDYNETI